MKARILIIPIAALLTLAISACTTAPAPELSPQLCEIAFLSEVDGVKIENPLVGTVQSVAGEEHRFTLPCTEETTFLLSKPCYDSVVLNLELESDSEYRLSADQWLHHAHLRFDNATKHPIYVEGFPSGRRLTVAPESHGSEAVPLGTWDLTVSADWKNPLQREVRLCQESEVVAFAVDSSGPTGELETLKTTSLELTHGVGSLRVLGQEDPTGLVFTLRASESSVESFLKQLGLTELVQVEDLKQIPENLRWVASLIKDGDKYRVPTTLVLPAGPYRLEIERDGETLESVDVEVSPNQETRLSIDVSASSQRGS